MTVDTKADPSSGLNPELTALIARLTVELPKALTDTILAIHTQGAADFLANDVKNRHRVQLNKKFKCVSSNLLILFRQSMAKSSCSEDNPEERKNFSLPAEMCETLRSTAQDAF